MPWRPLPWAPNLPPEFKKRRGYALDAQVVPSLIADAGAAGMKHRHDFWLTVGELVAENYFGQIQKCCRQLKFASGGHLLMEESLAAQVPLYGDFFRCARRLDTPGIDCLTSLPPEVPWQIARLLASVAELEGRVTVMSETSDHSQVWRPAGDARPKRVVTETEIRGTCNRLLVSGVNRITSYYSFAGLTNEPLRRLNQWVDRCGDALTGGHQVADIALVYPVESLWTHFVPARQWANESPAASRIESIYHAAADNLFEAQRDFTVVDSRALAEAKANAGALELGKLAWRVVILPGVDSLPLAAWENLERFVRRGGVAIALGALPANSESEFPSRRVRRLAREIFGASPTEPCVASNPRGGAGIFLPAGSEALLPLALRGVLEPEVRVSGARSPLRVTHRRIRGREVFFVINDSPRPWWGEVSLAAAGNGERWDPATDQHTPLTGLDHRVALDGYGARFFFCDRSVRPKRLRLDSGTLPNLSLRDLPSATPDVSQGEFVRAHLEPDQPRSRAGVPAWRAGGAIAKSKTDVFLFTGFRYERVLDLSGADCLAIETWVPEGQRTRSQILVILREEGGGDFIANTGRSLAVPGRETSFIPWSQFQLAGWSKDTDGALDLTRVREIRVGWGGYLGTEGENIEFTVGAPRMGFIGVTLPSAPRE